MITGTKLKLDGVIFTFFKKHRCPKCDFEMKPVKCSKIVNSKSPEAKNFDFSSGDSYMHGDVKFSWYEFRCAQCGAQYTASEVRRFERGGALPNPRAARKLTALVLLVMALTVVSIVVLCNFPTLFHHF